MKKITLLLTTAILLVTMAVSALAATPVEVQQNTVNGTQRLDKLFELAPSDDPNSVIEEPFEKDGFVYNLESIRFEEVGRSLSKEYVQILSVVTQSGDQSEILKKLSGSIPYADESGYSGTLYIDTGSIATEVEEYDTKQYTLTDTKEFAGMTINDPSGIPRTTTKNGVTLKLTDISWAVTGTTLVGDSLVPTQYKAVVTYSGSYSERVPTSYITTASYIGNLTLDVVDKLVVKVTYAGEPMPEPLAPEPQEKRPVNPMLVALLAGIAVMAAAGAAILLLRKPLVEISCYSDGEYKAVAKEPLDLRRPIIDLNSVREKITSLDMAFSLDRKTAARLNGKTVAVLLDGTVRQHLVDTSGEGEGYQFCIDFGGVL